MDVYSILKNGQVIKTKLIVDEIFKLEDRYDAKGLPSYEINSGEMIVPSNNTKTYAQ